MRFACDIFAVIYHFKKPSSINWRSPLVFFQWSPEHRMKFTILAASVTQNRHTYPTSIFQVHAHSNLLKLQLASTLHPNPATKTLVKLPPHI
ncbi:hypothetical protein FKM82_023415 [Ascaphus truei]